MGLLGDPLRRLVPVALLIDEPLAVDVHGVAVGLVDDAEVPVPLGGNERIEDPLGLHEVTGHDDEVVEVPRVLGRRGVEQRTVHLDAFDVEALRQFPLPLRTKIRRGDDEHPVGGPTELKFLDVEARHNRLARTGVVGQEEPEAGLFEKVAVDRFELVGQRHDVRDGQCRHVVLEADLDSGGLDPEAEPLGLPVKVGSSSPLHQPPPPELIERERHLAEPTVESR